jgi:hypothetical protein
LLTRNPYFGRGFLVLEKIFLKIIHKIVVILKRINIFVETIKKNNYENNSKKH